VTCLCICKVVVEVDMESAEELAVINAEIIELFVVISDVVLHKRLIHVQILSVIFPRVAAGVSVVR